MAINGTVGGGGVSPVAGPGGPRLTRQSYLVLGLIALAAAIVFAVIVWMSSGRKSELHEDAGGYGANLAFERPPVPRPKPVYPRDADADDGADASGAAPSGGGGKLGARRAAVVIQGQQCLGRRSWRCRTGGLGKGPG